MQSEVELLKKKIAQLEYENENLRSGCVFSGSPEEHDFLLCLFDSVNEYVYIADMDTHELLYVNKTLENDIGEVKGKKCFEVLQGLSEPCSFCTNEIIRNSPTSSHVWELYNPVLKRWYRCIDRTIPWSGNRLVRYELALDISDIREAEDEMRRFRMALEASSDAIYLTDVKSGFFVDVNSRAYMQLGYTRDEILQMGPEHINIAVKEHGLEAYLRNTLGANDEGAVETFHSRKDGSMIPVEVGLRRFRTASTELLVSVARDISERRDAQRDLATRLMYERVLSTCARELLTRFSSPRAMQRALNSLREAVDVCRVYVFENFTDNKGRLCCRQRYEVCAEGVPSQLGLPELQHVEFLPGYKRWVDTLSRGKVLCGVVKDFPAEERALLNLQQIKSLLVLPLMVGGEWWGFIGFDDTQNLRSWSQLDEQLLMTAGEIVAAAIERSRAQTQLEKTSREAEAASKSKSEFLANMSHEIRTPLNAIIGLTELSLQENLSDEVAENLKASLSSAEALLDIVNDILDLARVEAGRVHLEEVEFSLPRFLGGVMRVMRHEAERKGLEFSMFLGRGLPRELVGDSGRLRQILVNLIGNAIKFTEEGGVNVAVECIADKEGTRQDVQWVRFSVQDTGIGIPTHMHGLVFENFQQADGSITRKYGGTGLGLTISRQLVEMMGGTISLQSELAKGSRFQVELPFVVSTQLSVCHEEDQAVPVLRPFRVLLAEDNEINRRTLLMALKKLGHDVDTVTNGAEAVEQAGKVHYDCILMDVQMPVVDGLDATRAIRAFPRGCNATQPDVHITALTAHALAGDKERFVAAGMSAYLAKPVRLTELREHIEALQATVEEKGLEPECEAPAYDAHPVMLPFSGDAREAYRFRRFLVTVAALRESLWSAFDRGNWLELHSLAHTLMHEAERMGTPRVHVMATRLEDRVREGRPEEVRPIFLLLIDAVNHLEHELLKFFPMPDSSR
ncbi:ATP-binding protein [Oleidesulfovibrio sp.]|uniref:ATP-binding protein n=1 Tax=Oleidesulfovibrio sp. TaxID=2909707 RepID=UPI003A89230F